MFDAIKFYCVTPGKKKRKKKTMARNFSRHAIPVCVTHRRWSLRFDMAGFFFFSLRKLKPVTCQLVSFNSDFSNSFFNSDPTWAKVIPCCSANMSLSVESGYGLSMCCMNHACNASQVSLGIPLFLRTPAGQMLRGGGNLQITGKTGDTGFCRTFVTPVPFV